MLLDVLELRDGAVIKNELDEYNDEYEESDNGQQVLSDASLTALQSLTRVQTFSTIYLQHINISATGIHHLLNSYCHVAPHDTKLAHLILLKCSGNNASTVLNVARIQCIKSMKLIGCRGLFDDARIVEKFTNNIAELDNLEQLYMEDCTMMNDISMKNLSSSSSLQLIRFKNVQSYSPKSMKLFQNRITPINFVVVNK